MKATFSYFILALVCITVFPACEKQSTVNNTIINGTVIDAKSGLPLDSVAIEFRIYKGFDKNSGEQLYTTQAVGTDASGHFYSADLINGAAPFDIFTVRKTGYLSKGGGSKVVDIQLGQQNEVIIPMIPKDGTLRLNIQNNQSNPDTVYFVVYSPSQLQEATISFGKLSYETMYIVPPASQYAADFQVPSEESLTLYWNRAPQPTRFQEFPFHENVTVAKNGISTFTIQL